LKNFKSLFYYFITFNATFFFGQNTISTRFEVPENFVRVVSPKERFEFYLQHLPLKSPSSKVLYYNGSIKNKDVYCAVIDLPIGKKDLHQCADAIIRLRSDYFFDKKAFDKIHFNFTNGFRVDYSKWRQGYRIGINGNKTFWQKTNLESTSSESYWQYLETIFQYAGTSSLEKELKPVDISQMKIGDVFIKGGFPGHAIIVVDMAINPTTKKKVFMLAQSYMPAQELQILKNFNNIEISPWYELAFGEQLITPEWDFTKNNLKRFED
jgi:hypothetical protein